MLFRSEGEAEVEEYMDEVDSNAYAKAGGHIVSGLYSGSVLIMDPIRDLIYAFLRSHRMNSIAFSPDGSRVVSGLYHMTVRIWNVTSGKMEAELKGHTDLVISVAFSQDGSQVVSGSLDKTIRIWNLMTGEIKTELMGHMGWVMSVAFSQDGNQVVSGSDDKTVRIWNVITGEVEVELRGHEGRVMSVAFSQDGSQVVSAADRASEVVNWQTSAWDYEKIRIWDIVTGEFQLMTTTTITLPDGSVVDDAGNGCFHIFYPEQLTFSIHCPLSISNDCEWILGALQDCCIPISNRNFISSSFSGDRVCFVYASGNVIIVDMKVALAL